MAQPRGAAVVIIGGGVTGLSAGWWLARSGVDVLVLEKNIVGWEASGRNGGGGPPALNPLRPRKAAPPAPTGSVPRYPHPDHPRPDRPAADAGPPSPGPALGRHG